MFEFLKRKKFAPAYPEITEWSSPAGDMTGYVCDGHYFPYYAYAEHWVKGLPCAQTNMMFDIKANRKRKVIRPLDDVLEANNLNKLRGTQGIPYKFIRRDMSDLTPVTISSKRKGVYALAELVGVTPPVKKVPLPFSREIFDEATAQFMRSIGPGTIERGQLHMALSHLHDTIIRLMANE